MRQWRWPSWAIAIWTVLIAAWIVGGVQSAKVTNEARAAGAGVAVFIILILWFLIVIPLALLWFATRPRS